MAERIRDARHCQTRKVCLLLDNWVAHVFEVKLKSVHLCYFPPKVTSVIQPLEQGIINTEMHLQASSERQAAAQFEAKVSEQG